MPHQCTECDRRFPDGSKEMLSGCPDCGGNKFQFVPKRSSGGADPEGKGSGSADPDPDPLSNASVDRTSEGERSAGESAGATERSNEGSRGHLQRAVEAVTGNDSDAQGTDDRDSGTVDSDPGTVDRDPETVDPDEADPDSGRTDEESVYDWVNRRREEAGQPTVDPEELGGSDDEDNAQASARSEVVSPDELPGFGSSGDEPSEPTDSPEAETGADPSTGPGSANADGEPAGPEPQTDREDPGTEERTAAAPEPRTSDAAPRSPSEAEQPVDSPDLEELRKELNQQFESIKIVRPGEYEIDLMNLYDRQEYIISLMEDGRYAIEVPDKWDD